MGLNRSEHLAGHGPLSMAQYHTIPEEGERDCSMEMTQITKMLGLARSYQSYARLK